MLGWEKLPEGRTLGIISGAFPDPDGQHLWMLDRCGGNQCARRRLETPAVGGAAQWSTAALTGGLSSVPPR